MANKDRSPRWVDDPLLRWIVGVAIGLTVFTVALFLYWGPGPVIIALPWFVPAVHSFVALAAVSIAFLSFERYQVLRQPAPFWIGAAFSLFTVFVVLYVLSFPGLLPDGRGLISQMTNTMGWFYHLQFSALAIFLLAAVFARWPREGAAGERWWFWLVLAGMVASVLVGWLSLVYEPLLPLLVVGLSFTSLTLAWNCLLVVAFLVTAALSAHRYQQTRDSLFGYVALAELQFGFAVLTSVIGGRFYDLWWYWQRPLWIGGVSVLLFGLLSEYVGLYRRERESLEEAQEERNRLQAVINTAPVGIVIYGPGPRPRVLASNEASEVMLGRPPPPPEVSVSDEPAYYGLYRPTGEPWPAEELPCVRALRGEASVGVEILVRQPSGREVHILNNAAPLRDAKGRIVGAIVAFQDITAIREQEQLRDEFISAAAHELKSPVAIIKGYAQLMRQWEPHEMRHAAAVEVINTQTDRITRRVQEMLEAIRFRKAPPELYLERFDLGDLTAQVVQRMQTTTELHLLALKREEPVPVEADRERIEEVLVSLLDNAIKFSPRGGGIEVRVWAEKGEGLVSVTDHGVGIPEERQRYIFEPFYEPVPSGAPGYRGVVALSLYLSKLTIERHKGRIWFESEEGKGSTFYFSLPLTKGDGNGRGA